MKLSASMTDVLRRMAQRPDEPHLLGRDRCHINTRHALLRRRLIRFDGLDVGGAHYYRITHLGLASLPRGESA